jgi:hypothetical protein
MILDHSTGHALAALPCDAATINPPGFNGGCSVHAAQPVQKLAFVLTTTTTTEGEVTPSMENVLSRAELAGAGVPEWQVFIGMHLYALVAAIIFVLAYLLECPQLWRDCMVVGMSQVVYSLGEATVIFFARRSLIQDYSFAKFTLTDPCTMGSCCTLLLSSLICNPQFAKLFSPLVVVDHLLGFAGDLFGISGTYSKVDTTPPLTFFKACFPLCGAFFFLLPYAALKRENANYSGTSWQFLFPCYCFGLAWPTFNIMWGGFMRSCIGGVVREMHQQATEPGQTPWAVLEARKRK